MESNSERRQYLIDFFEYLLIFIKNEDAFSFLADEIVDSFLLYKEYKEDGE